jgi:methylglutaconyl-CoA hydratase
LNAGLIHYVGDVDKNLAMMIKLFKKAAPEAIAETKKLLRFLHENPKSKYRKQTTSVIAKRRVSKEGQAGLQSFLEKKSTPWE